MTTPELAPGNQPDDNPGPDLASRWLGGSVMAASDEAFGEKENLLNPEPPHFEPGHYGPRGEIVDGWETRRRRELGHDWALIHLGTPGIITSIELDTSNFTGNFPSQAAIQACGLEGYPGAAALLAADWIEIVPRSSLSGDAHNWFPVTDPRRFSHLRLAIFPDGGVARLRVHGVPLPDPRELDGLTLDLASQQLGGRVSWSSDRFYTSARLLNRPDQARSMGEGWETRRRRDDGHDAAVIQLGLAGIVRQLIVDTAHFRYNASAAIELYGTADGTLDPADPGWAPLLARTSLQPDTRHVLPVATTRSLAAVRIDAFPDGGLSRVRVIGSVDPAARGELGERWLNALPEGQARACLAAAGLTDQTTDQLLAARPLTESWLSGARLDPADLDRLSALLNGHHS